MDFSFHDIEKSFIEAMESCGISPASGEQLRMDGHKHRIKLAGDKGRATSGEYCIYGRVSGRLVQKLQGLSRSPL